MDNSGWNSPAPAILHPLSAAVGLLAAITLGVWSWSLDLAPDAQ